jgi:hypothetical protein
MTALLVILAFSFTVGAVWLGAYLIDRAFRRMENARRIQDALWRIRWRD